MVWGVAGDAGMRVLQASGCSMVVIRECRGFVFSALKLWIEGDAGDAGNTGDAYFLLTLL